MMGSYSTQPALRPPAAVIMGGVKATSKAALREHGEKLETLADRIVRHMKANPVTHTRAELAQAMNIPTATMSGRINALVNAGRVIEEPGKYKCRITGNMVGGVSAA